MLGLSLFLSGIAGAVIAGSFEDFGDDPIGPRFVPQVVCCTISFLGLVLAIGEMRQRESAFPNIRRYRQSLRELDLRPLRTIALAFLYVCLIPLIGYAAATLVAACLVIWCFGRRSPAVLVTTATAAALVYHVIFVVLLGVYFPPGRWFDIAGILSSLITGA